MHINVSIDIPAVQALANAINNLASKGALCIPTVSGEMVDYYNQKADEQLAALEPTDPGTPVTAEPTPAPKRTRRTKAEIEAERKAIEEQKGRRVDLTTTTTEGESTEQNVVTDPLEPEPNPFQWTLEQLVDTFIAPIQPADKTEEAKEKANALRSELVAIRKEVDPKAQKMIEVDPQHYPELAKRFTAWFKDKGLELQLPEGAE